MTHTKRPQARRTGCLTAIRITDGGLKKLIREAPASHSREQAGNHHSWSEPSGCGLTSGVMKKIKGGDKMCIYDIEEIPDGWSCEACPLFEEGDCDCE